MPKSKKGSAKTDPVQVTQQLYARAYASRLAKQVAEELERSRRKATGAKKRDGKRQPRLEKA